ncbi:RING-H2 finger protein [Streptomyces sp. NPDC047028]|uniref:RING-H2 finger protein n=1 Tax=Streptomyces sp. NPDC047028 TaxID=3155793 RepID=UPI0033EDB727
MSTPTGREIRAKIQEQFKDALTTIELPSLAQITRMQKEWLEETQRVDYETAKVKGEKDYEEEQKKTIEVKAQEKAHLETREKEVRTGITVAGTLETPACAHCSKPFGVDDTISVTPDCTHGHVVHEDCYADWVEANTCRLCSSPENWKTSRPISHKKDYITILGHGSDAGTSTFVPLGMTVYTFARPGATISAAQAQIIMSNPLLSNPPYTFPPGAQIPNVVLSKLDDGEQAIDDDAYDSLFPEGAPGVAGTPAAEVAAMFAQTRQYGEIPDGMEAGQEPDAAWVQNEYQLCTSSSCRSPFHLCSGLLSVYRGVTNIYIAACGGEITTEDLQENAIDELFDQLIAVGKTDPVKAIGAYLDCHPLTRQNLKTHVEFPEWLTLTLDNAVKKLKSPPKPKEAEQQTSTTGAEKPSTSTVGTPSTATTGAPETVLPSVYGWQALREDTSQARGRSRRFLLATGQGNVWAQCTREGSGWSVIFDQPESFTTDWSNRRLTAGGYILPDGLEVGGGKWHELRGAYVLVFTDAPWEFIQPHPTTADETAAREVLRQARGEMPQAWFDQLGA